MRSSGLRKFVISALLLFLSISIGISGFKLIEGYTLLDSVYMTVITLSTVGFKEVEPLSDSGKLFATLYILFNIGIFAYIVSTITKYLFEGELQKTFRNIMFGREVKRLKNHIIVCGYGRNGSRACLEFVKSNTPYLIIEKDSSNLEFSQDARPPVIVGDATSDDTLLEAGINRAYALITTLPHDADNVFITLTAKELNPAVRVIARASDRNAEKKLLRAGADRVVLPDILGGIYMAHLITKPHVVEFLDILNGLGDAKLMLEDYSVGKLKEEYKNKAISDLKVKENTGAVIVGIRSEVHGFIFGPEQNTVVRDNDVLILLGSEESLRRFNSYKK